MSTGKSITVCALAVLTGVMWLQSLRDLPDPFWLQFLPLSLLCALYSNSMRLTAWVLSGFLYALFQAHIHFQHVLPETLAGNDVWVSGKILDIPRVESHVVRFDMDISSSELPVKRIRLGWYRSNELPKAGEYWQLKVRLKPPHGSLNPGGYDYEQALYQRGIQATGYVREEENNRCLSSAPVYSIDALRQVIADNLKAGGFEYSGLLTALAVGYTGDISSDQWNAMILTGTNHLIAISGSHVSLVAGLVYWLVLRLVPVVWLKRMAAQPVAAMAALIAACFYASLAGFSVPTQRAVIMLAVILGAKVLRRPVTAVNSLSAALLAVIVLDPLAVLAPGFWFSFMAVAIIFYGFSSRLAQQGLWWRFGRIHWLITLGLFPLTVFMFQQASLISPLANFVMVPWVTLVVVPLILSGVLLMLVSDTLSDVILSLADQCLALIWPALDWLAHRSLAVWVQAAPDMLTIILALMAVVILIMPKGLPHRWLGGVMLVPFFFIRPPIPAMGDFRASVIDVGQGLSVYVQTHTHHLLFDTGASFGEDTDAGERMVLPYLRQQGVQQLDAMIISNGDSDHSGGAASILAQLNVEVIKGQDLEELVHSYKHLCNAGDSWMWDGVKFQFLHPDQYEPKSNNRSCVLKVDNGKESLLIAADIEKKIEKRLVERFPTDLPASVLIVPHHGSKTSSSEEWIEAVQPLYALVSAGYRNRYGHPRPEVVKRYTEAGSVVLNTADSGTIEIYFDHDAGLNVQSWRQTARHYWNAPYSH